MQAQPFSGVGLDSYSPGMDMGCSHIFLERAEGILGSTCGIGRCRLYPLQARCTGHEPVLTAHPSALGS